MTKHLRQAAIATGTVLLLSGARQYLRNWGTTKEECRTILPGD